MSNDFHYSVRTLHTLLDAGDGMYVFLLQRVTQSLSGASRAAELWSQHATRC